MSQPNPTGAGRPRDPSLDERVYVAASRLYAQSGWAGFSIEAVAREARVGKSSIYLRWPDTTALLLDTLKTRINMPYDDTDTGSARGDLIVLLGRVLRALAGENGDAILRLSSEGRLVPELADRWQEFLTANVTPMRRIVRRGITRGDLPEGTNVNLLLDTLFGGVLMRCLMTPPSGMPALAKKADKYCQSLVDLSLANLG
ncbi:TetR-like C-terminal domain-containing protein [[Mycobacterium] vasticus]|uniref:TetR-like C-terminal domain-containing protein n=1 Tax=[Mycobacterium] vasticus TaxID=2875777 RepID=A0ABU5Z2W7_9MYCO|nr:TetR-like C-terminal domain-containing protein [Mycolicibacter sp. MYC017]MEB3071480.1 TetR-like C-terminal domain-containing protein [Mycolicibacter sp. MYC017]